MAGPRVQWRTKRVEAIKSQLAETIESWRNHSGKEEALNLILRRVSSLEDGTTVDEAIERFILVVHCLNHHRKFGGLSKSQVNNLVGLGYAILQVNGVKTQSPLGYLYGEIHLMLSEIEAGSGKNLEAAWERQLCIHLSGKNPPGGTSLNNLILGIHSLKLGASDLAMDYLLEAESSGLSAMNFEKARIMRLQALRLSQRTKEFYKLLSETTSMEDVSEQFQTEASWEAMCMAITEGKEHALRELVSNIGKGKLFYGSSYYLEAYLWIYAVQTKGFFDRLPKLSTLAKNKDVRVRRHPLYKAIVEIDSAYQVDIPLSTRLKTMKKIISSIDNFSLIDKKLLIYMAIARWLLRFHFPELASLVYSQYRLLSLQLSLGKSIDALGIGSDIYEKSVSDTSHKSA